jgi:hypothetical protein
VINRNHEVLNPYFQNLKWQIDIEYRKLAQKAGIRQFHRASSLNTDPGFIEALARITLQNIHTKWQSMHHEESNHSHDRSGSSEARQKGCPGEKYQGIGIG